MEERFGSFVALRTSLDLITGERHQSYGSANASFTRVAAGWEQILGCEITPRQVALCMAWLKISREVNKHKNDNLVDAISYIALAADVGEVDAIAPL